MEQIEAAAGQIAGFGCKLWPILQDLGQLEALYKERWQTFMGNAGVLQFFGNNDVKTLEYISQRLGKTTVLVESAGDVSAPQAYQGATGLSRAPQVHDLLTAEEAGRFFARDAPQHRQLIIRAGKDPAMAIGRMVYYEDPLFRGKFDVLE
jgi:type IV secretion system protein VirD4